MRLIKPVVQAVRAFWRELFFTPDAVHVMVDLEALGVTPGYKILSIGAVVMTPQGPAREFYCAAKRESQNRFGLRELPSTMEWWAKQSPAAREAAFSNKEAVVVEDALQRFSRWLVDVALDPMTGERRKVLVWGNGAGFDQPILSAVYTAVGYTTPWKYYNERCYRTLKSLYQEVKFIEPGVKHHAFEDAKAQAEHAIKILNRSEHGWE